MKIVADNTVPFLKGIAEPIAEVKYLTSKEFTPENVQDADILIVRSIDKCTRELLEGSRVKLITSATIGFDHIDTRYCDKAGTHRDAMPSRSPNMCFPDWSRSRFARVNPYRGRRSGSSVSVMSEKRWRSYARPTG